MATNLSSKAIGKRLQHQLLPAIVKFDYRSKRALKDSQRVARPPRVQWFSNGMVLIERDNEVPEFISMELFSARYIKAGIN